MVKSLPTRPPVVHHSTSNDVSPAVRGLVSMLCPLTALTPHCILLASDRISSPPNRNFAASVSHANVVGDEYAGAELANGVTVTSGFGVNIVGSAIITPPSGVGFTAGSVGGVGGGGGGSDAPVITRTAPIAQAGGLFVMVMLTVAAPAWSV